LATVTPIEYNGHVWCVEVPTGAFVARRNGKIFITGNSGFPKSHNIGKAVDKIQGNEREDLGKHPQPGTAGKTHTRDGGAFKDDIHLTKGTSPHEGWGTNLKPALEPITVARKPISEKTIAKNVVKWGTGGINIDGSRVESTEFSKDIGTKRPQSDDYVFKSFDDKTRPSGSGASSELGRFPANLIHDGSDEVVGLFPDTGGSAARYFYCAKASKKERNKGLEGFEERIVNDGRETSIDNAYQRGDSLRANTHPTVKPVKLMRYLVKLVTPAGGIVLDPFNGSGTTGIACKLESFDYIGIELDPEYVKLSEARIKAWGNEPEQQELQ